MDALAHDPVAAAILLASTAAGDPDAGLAALDPALRARVETVMRVSAALRTRGRETSVAALIAATAAPVPAEIDAAPARARSVIASLVALERGSAWLREAGAPRTGFRAGPALRTTITCTDGTAWRA